MRAFILSCDPNWAKTSSLISMWQCQRQKHRIPELLCSPRPTACPSRKGWSEFLQLLIKWKVIFQRSDCSREQRLSAWPPRYSQSLISWSRSLRVTLPQSLLSSKNMRHPNEPCNPTSPRRSRAVEIKCCQCADMWNHIRQPWRRGYRFPCFPSSMSDVTERQNGQEVH